MRLPLPLIRCLALPLLAAGLSSAAADPLVVPLWADGAPGSQARMHEAEVVGMHDRNTPMVYNIHNPSLTVYLPAAGTATGAAIIVAPGGGHMFLSYIHEGSAVAQWFAQHGVAGFLLKYRLARDQAGNSPYKVAVDGLADAQRSIRVVRSRAADWGVNPARIGILGFSAGGELAMLATLHARRRQARRRPIRSSAPVRGPTSPAWAIPASARMTSRSRRTCRPPSCSAPTTTSAPRPRSPPCF